MLKKVIYLLIAICLFACKSEVKDSKTFKLIKNYEFHSGFFTGNAQVEFFNNKEYICFGDYNSYKKIVIHSLEDTVEKHISLKKITDLGEKILRYEVVTLDTLLILAKYTNSLYIIDGYGKIVDTKIYEPNSGEGYSYELKGVSSAFRYNDTTLFFSLEYKDNNVSTNFWDNPENNLNKRYSAAILFKIDNYKKDLSHQKVGLNNLYNNFTNSNNYIVEGNNFTFINNKIIFISSFSDSLYIIDSKSLTISKKVKVQSKYSTNKLIAFKNKEIKNNIEKYNSVFTSNGRIGNIFYDKKQNLYYVFAVHKKKEKTWPWSIIVLDSNFNKIDEVKMNETKYSFSGMMTSKGLLISNYYETLHDKDHFKKNTYSLFRYE